MDSSLLDISALIPIKLPNYLLVMRFTSDKSLSNTGSHQIQLRDRYSLRQKYDLLSCRYLFSIVKTQYLIIIRSVIF